MKSTGEIIKLLRESRGLTQEQLADITGAKTYTTISKWESGKNLPRGREIKTLCEYFNVSSDYLLGLTDNEMLPIQESDYPYYNVSISAGLPIEVEAIKEGDHETITIPDLFMGKWAGSRDVYITQVNGESMNNIIPHNSFIAVRQVEIFNLKDGDIVIYSENGDYSLKRFYNDRERQRIIFRPDSKDSGFADFIASYSDADSIKIHGKVVLYIVELN